MDLSHLEQAWSQQTVAAPAVPAATVSARLESEVRSAQRRFRGTIVMAVSLLVLGWITTLAAHLTGIKPLTPLTVLSQVIGSALYIALLARALQSARAARAEIACLGGSLRDSIAATQRTLELQIQNTRIAAVAIPLVVASGAWLFLAKHLAGEMPGFSAVLASSFLALLGTLIGAALWHRHRTVLAPRHRELTETLSTLE
ncbi:MAG: hypothetical protein JNN01_20160 [Opitutaceae bacterium]|nr:hypothetical protein [Opitutaceae bacterium]